MKKFCTLFAEETSAFQKQVKEATDTLGAKVDCLEKMHGLPSTGK